MLGHNSSNLFRHNDENFTNEKKKKLTKVKFWYSFHNPLFFLVNILEWIVVL